MEPYKQDLTIWRGTSFNKEFIAQVKKYTYDPVINNSKSDMIRTHEENLKHYGFVYEYVDFATIYTSAKLMFKKSWIKTGQTAEDALLVLTSIDGDIILTNRSVKINLNSELTKLIDFDTASYELVLVVDTDTPVRIDKLIYGTVTVNGDK